MTARLVVASGNAHKLAELAAMLDRTLGDGACEVLGLPACARRYGEPPEIEESAPDFSGNAALKATGFAAWLARCGEPGATRVLADDSGVCVDALGGAPGVLSARFAGAHGSDAANNAQLVAALRERDLHESPAHYACVLALCRVDATALPASGGQPVLYFEGRWDVVARVQSRGSGGFGYDPHCWLPGADRTVAELSADDKATRSHRGAALAAMVQWWSRAAALSAC